MSVDVVYSPLCDTNPSMYLAYLVCKYRDGQRAGVAYAECGRGGDGADGGCGVDVERGFDIAYRAACVAAGADHNGVGGVGVARGGGCGTSCYTGSVIWERQGSDVGISDRNVVGSGRSVVGGCVGAQSTAVCSSQAAVVEVVRGPNYERNRANRMRRKARDNDLKLASPTSPKPFFSGCDPHRVAELKAARLEANIAESRKRQLRAEHATEKLKLAIAARSCVGGVPTDDTPVTPPRSIVSVASGPMTSVSKASSHGSVRRTEGSYCSEILEALREVDITHNEKFKIARIIKERQREMSVIV